MTPPTLDRLPLGYLRHPSADVAKDPGVDIRSAVTVSGDPVRADLGYPEWVRGLAPGRPTSVPAPTFVSELR